MNKILFFALMLLLPVYAHAGYYIKKPPVALRDSTISIASPTTDSIRAQPPQSWLKYMLLAKHSPKSIGILSLFLGMVGIVGAVTMVLTWVTLPLIAVIAAAGMFAFGAGAYVTGYASVLSHPKEAMGVIGYVIGILECLPLILVIDFVFGAISIGKFVFRRKHKSHTDNLSTQVK